MKKLNLIPIEITQNKIKKQFGIGTAAFLLMVGGVYVFNNQKVSDLKDTLNKKNTATSSVPNYDTEISQLQAEITKNEQLMNVIDSQDFSLFKFLSFVANNMPKDMWIYTIDNGGPTAQSNSTGSTGGEGGEGGMPAGDPAAMTGGMPAGDPAAMAGGMPAGDPAAMAGGMPAGDPAAMTGGMPAGAPATMTGGMPAGDPAAMAGGMPAGDPNMAGGMPTGDPNMAGGMPGSTPNTGTPQTGTKENKFTIKGASLSARSIGSFVQDLNEQGLFDKIEVPIVQELIINGKKYIAFEIYCTVSSQKQESPTSGTGGQ